MRVWIPGLAGAVLAMGACAADAPGPGEWAGTISDSAGITVVANPEAGVWTSETGWTLEEELRIGVADGDPTLQFGQVVDIAVDEGGRMYVLDQQAREVRVFGPAGEFIRRIGGPGSGPGELTGPAAVLLAPGDTVLVADAAQQRVNRYLADGSEAGDFGTPITEGLPMKWVATPDGRLILQVRTLPLPQMPDAPEWSGLLVRGVDGAVRDTLLELPVGETMRMQGGQAEIEIFAPEPMWTVLADGRLASGRNSEYRVELRASDGGLERVLTKPFERRPVGESDREAFLRFMRDMFEQQGVPPQAVQMVLDGVQFAEFYPAFANMLGGPDGTLWIQHVQSAADVEAPGTDFSAQDFGGPAWDVFDAEGRFLGTVRTPDRFNALRLRGDHVYGVWRDDLDVQYVMRLRITRPQEVGD